MAGYRPPYTLSEEKQILAYIIEKKGYWMLRGTKIWKEMEKAKAVNRTWQSAKEHFRKKIFPNLDRAHYNLSEGTRSEMRQGFLDSAGIKKGKKRPQIETSPSSSPVAITDPSDSSDDDTP